MLANNTHRLTFSFGAALVAVALGSGVAYADTTPSPGLAGERNTLRLRTFKVADVVVQQPTPVQPTVVAPTTPVVETGPRKVVQTDTRSRGSYMGTIAWSAIGGAVLGAAVGTAIYYLDEDDNPSARNIAYWAAGGVLLGAGVGVIQVMVEESRTSSALSLRAPKDPAPTLRVALYRSRF
jgi:hypothetical protein